jgi:multidrug efflux pump subunit AcrA (membrane-fusion protein)
LVGVVRERRLIVGVTATLMPPSFVLVLQDVDKLELRARLPESALADVREGSEISARFPSVNQTRKVTVKRIAPTIDARTRTIEIVADIDNSDRRLLVGMLAEVTYGDGAKTAQARELTAPATAKRAAEPETAEAAR